MSWECLTQACTETPRLASCRPTIRCGVACCDPWFQSGCRSKSEGRCQYRTGTYYSERRARAPICNPLASRGRVDLRKVVKTIEHKNSFLEEEGRDRDSPNTLRFKLGPNRGLFMYTRPAEEIASLTATLVKKSPWWSSIGASSTFFFSAHSWNLVQQLSRTIGLQKCSNCGKKLMYQTFWPWQQIYSIASWIVLYFNSKAPASVGWQKWRWHHCKARSKPRCFCQGSNHHANLRSGVIARVCSILVLPVQRRFRDLQMFSQLYRICIRLKQSWDL